MYCVETKKLSHCFSGQQVLNEINIQVPYGCMYGFLGPNGAGKTTSLRLLLGLIKKQEGEILLFGKSLKENRIAILQKTGSLIESPSLYGHLTARENLLLLQKIHQCPIKRIEEVLLTVGLATTGNKKAAQFSLGMKQRLSIAAALLHNPKLLILDEPTNGLDPNGIMEMRTLLKKINEEEAVTIIISSHLLAEIEKLVTEVGIISKGKMVFQGSLHALISKQNNAAKLIIATSDIPHSIEIIRSQQLNGIVENGKLILPLLSNDMIATINRQLASNGIDVFEMTILQKDLETIFMELINEKS